MFEGGVSRRAEAKYLPEGGKDGAKRVLACDVSTSLTAAKGWLAGLRPRRTGARLGGGAGRIGDCAATSIGGVNLAE